MGVCFALISLSALKSIALPILGLGIVIFVHELGHFLVAKACGVKCEKFYVGFDVPISLGPIKLPAALFRKKWGETEYGIGIVPLGGYVKMLGQDDNPANAAREAERAQMDKETGTLDPRSYTAKSVPQRMAIISAGVIMNLIFAVIFATIAYRIGVKYIPCDIGKTMPGEPAWSAGIEPGDRILQLGRKGEPDDQLRFVKDLRPKVAFTDRGQELELLVRHLDGENEWIKVTPNQSMADRMGGLPTIGIMAASSNKFGNMSAATAKRLPGFEDQDEIVGMVLDGEETAIDTGWQLERLLAQHPEKTLQLRVSRRSDENSAAEEAIVSLPPRQFLDVGLLMKVPPIGAVRPGSPADKAGFRPGDTILQINDEPFLNTLLLDRMLLPFAGQQVTCHVLRKDGTEADLQVTPDAPLVLRSYNSFALGTVGSDMLGIALPHADSVASVLEGSPAANAGLQAGDVLTGVAFPKPQTNAEEGVATPSQEIEFDQLTSFDDGLMNWSLAFHVLQIEELGEHLKLQFARAGELQEVEMAAVPMEGVYNPDRGLPLVGIERLRTADSLSDAFQLGFRETKEGVSQVFSFLQRITRLYKSIGGPLLIFAQAKQETDQGVANLLTFLTMLSANLAVLNLLPIPVLDGGHLMFLTYEGVTGRPVNERIVVGLTMVGLSFLLGLMVWVFGMDIHRLFLA